MLLNKACSNEEIIKKEMGVDNSHALVVDNRGRNKSRGNSKGRTKSGDKETKTCYYCNKLGHIKTF